MFLDLRRDLGASEELFAKGLEDSGSFRPLVAGPEHAIRHATSSPQPDWFSRCLLFYFLPIFGLMRAILLQFNLLFLWEAKAKQWNRRQLLSKGMPEGERQTCWEEASFELLTTLSTGVTSMLKPRV